jgi:hypothetical protein
VNQIAVKRMRMRIGKSSCKQMARYGRRDVKVKSKAVVKKGRKKAARKFKIHYS